MNNGTTGPPPILSDRGGFIETVVRRLAEYPHGFAARKGEIDDQQRQGIRISTSGVILLVRFSEENGEWEVILTKRSAHVTQPGDLSFPGGHVHKIDKYHGWLIAKGLSPCILGQGIDEGRGSGDRAGFRIAADYLATALREAREETGIRCRAVRYLGSLPSYGMVAFRRVIYPAVGVVERAVAPHLSWEVERLLFVGLSDFYDAGRFAWIRFDVPDDIREASARSDWDFPCLVIGQGAEREILWGATFNIILTFLWIVLGFPLPEIPQDRLVTKEIPDNYFTGGFRKALKDGFAREGRGRKDGADEA